MKGKVFGVVVVMALVFGLMFSVSCSKSSPSSPDATATTVPTATATATPVLANAFAAGVEGWYINAPAAWTNNDALTPPTVWDSVNGNTNTASSAGCLSGTGDFDASVNAKHKAGDFEYAFSANKNLTGKTITAWIKAPAAVAADGTYHVAIYVKNGADYSYGYNGGGDIIFSSTDWTKISWTAVCCGTSTMTEPGLQNVAMIGFNVYRTDSTVAHDLTGQTFLIDDISVK